MTGRLHEKSSLCTIYFVLKEQLLYRKNGQRYSAFFCAMKNFSFHHSSRKIFKLRHSNCRFPTLNNSNDSEYNKKKKKKKLPHQNTKLDEIMYINSD